MHIKILNGTQQGSGSTTLCTSCINSTRIRGHKYSDEIIVCHEIHPSRPINFAVTECSEYHSKRDPSLKNMEQIAWDVNVKGGRVMGFDAPKIKPKAKGEDGDPSEYED